MKVFGSYEGFEARLLSQLDQLIATYRTNSAAFSFTHMNQAACILQLTRGIGQALRRVFFDQFHKQFQTGDNIGAFGLET